MSPNNLVPFRWPSAWRDPASLSLIAGSPINCLLLDDAATPLADAARNAGLTVIPSHSLASAPLDKIKWDAPTSPIVITDLVWPRMKIDSKGLSRRRRGRPHRRALGRFQLLGRSPRRRPRARQTALAQLLA